MKNFLLFPLLLASTGLALAQDKLGFIFEINRHGARAPFEGHPGLFNAPLG